MPQYLIVDSTLRWLEAIFGERFGHEWNLLRVKQSLYLKLVGADGAIIFDQLEEGFTKSGEQLPCAKWDAKQEGWQAVLDKAIPAPAVSSLPVPLVEQSGINHVVHYDIVGLVYWMLNRVEEIEHADLDRHGRFPATASHAYNHGYIDRPVVDEWLDILGQAIQRQWPEIKLKVHQPKIFVTCDVDSPYAFDSSLARLPRRLAVDILKRRSARMAWNTLRGVLRGGHLDYTKDPYIKNIDWMMDVNEQAGNQVAFYFITGGSHAFDAYYRMNEPVIRRLLRHIHERGHEIGLHPSYMTYLNPEQTQQEANVLRYVLGEEGIAYSQLGGRQHYLRWQTGQTARNWESAGLYYDSTLSYADHPGFRCGTSHEFIMFDIEQSRQLELRQRPLIVMESSVIEENYMGLGYTDEALAYMLSLKKLSFLMGGAFTLLWHNCSFNDAASRSMYKELIQ